MQAHFLRGRGKMESLHTRQVVHQAVANRGPFWLEAFVYRRVTLLSTLSAISALFFQRIRLNLSISSRTVKGRRGGGGGGGQK